jgi:hypothetical protein
MMDRIHSQSFVAGVLAAYTEAMQVTEGETAIQRFFVDRNDVFQASVLDRPLPVGSLRTPWLLCRHVPLHDVVVRPSMRLTSMEGGVILQS